jgi:FkbM family methyltransferase
MLTSAIGKFASYLRATLPRDSPLRRLAAGLARIGLSLHYRNPINRYRWRANHTKFERNLDEYSRETQDFFVVQIGAFDGVMDDPIRAHIKRYRWHGILIEPQRKEFESLKLNYRDEADILAYENVAIAAQNGTQALHRVGDVSASAEWQRMTASLVPISDSTVHSTTEMVECITFDRLFTRHRVERIDLLQIDVEGYDYELLKLLNFATIRPRLIRYEHRHLNLAQNASCRKYLVYNGYELLPMQYDTGAVLKRC